MGPLGGVCIKYFDKLTEKKIKESFKVFVDFFSVGVVGMLLCIAGFSLVSGVVTVLTSALTIGMQWMVDMKLIPLTSILIEPAKVLFLNNIVGHGVLNPIALASGGESILYLIEPNPGAGLGILLALSVLGVKEERTSAPGAAVIVAFGGIHELYFPYIMARPRLLIAAICGSSSALLFYTLMNGALVAPAAPGSIIALLLMAPKGKTFIVLAGFVIATVVSFLVSALLLGFKRRRNK